MPAYKYKNSLLWNESTDIVDKEIEELAAWLHSSEIDVDFTIDHHVHVDEEGNRILFLPWGINDRQLFTMTLILSSSELSFEDKPVHFDKPPVEYVDDNWKPKPQRG